MDENISSEVHEITQSVTSLGNQHSGFVSQLCNLIFRFMTLVLRIMEQLIRLYDPNKVLRCIAMQLNSLVTDATEELCIVINKDGETPPHETSLKTIEGIRNMSDEQVRLCLEFYGKHDVSSRKDLMKCLNVDTRELIDDKNSKAKLYNRFVKSDQQQLMLFVNEVGEYPENGQMVNGTKKLSLGTLKNPNNNDLYQLLDFYHLEHEYLDSFEEKLDFLLSMLKFLTTDYQLDRIRSQMGELHESVNNLTESVNNLTESMNRSLNEHKESLTASVNASLNEHKESVNASVNASLNEHKESLTASVNASLTASLNEHKDSVNSSLNGFQESLTQLRNEMRTENRNLKLSLTRKITSTATDTEKRAKNVIQLTSRKYR